MIYERLKGQKIIWESFLGFGSLKIGRNTFVFLMMFLGLTIRVTETFSQSSDLANTKIAFETSRDGNSEIYIMDFDGKNQTRLTNNPAYDGSATWSPDGKKIAFVSDRDGNTEIYIMDANGANQIRITKNPAEESSPAWSPDGSMIAFNTSRYGGQSDEILRRNISGGETWGTNDTRLTFVQLHHSGAANNFIAWSPDGRQIAFESDRDRDDPEIYLINAVDGTNMQRLTFTRALDEVPAWSPDSKQIIFSSDMHGDPQSGEYDIYIMNRDGSNQKRLTHFDRQDTNPSMSPDGSMIVFESWQNGNPEIYRMNTDGNDMIRLTVNDGLKEGLNKDEAPKGSSNPKWSPFLK